MAAFGRPGIIHHERKNIASANGQTFFWIPKTCYYINVKDTAGTANNVQIKWKLIRSHDANTENDPESTNLGTEYSSFRARSGGVTLDGIRLIDTYLLLVESNTADTDIELTYMLGF